MKRHSVNLSSSSVLASQLLAATEFISYLSLPGVQVVCFQNAGIACILF